MLDGRGVADAHPASLTPLVDAPCPALDAAFLKESEAAGLLALKGHKAVGGMRASIYNAMPIAGVQALVDFMADFTRRNG